MKRLLFLLSAFAFAVSVSAQTPEAILDIIRQNPNFAEPTVTTYENIKIGKIAAAPKGYEPFYFSMTSRHGSRYELYDESFATPNDIFNKASELGILTPLGEEVKAIINRATDDQMGKGGELTLRGQEQLRAIGRRAYNNFGKIFEGGSIDGKSSTKMRCVFSMVAFVDGLKEKLPTLPVEMEARESFVPMLRPMANHPDTPKNLIKVWEQHGKIGEGWKGESMEWLCKQDMSQILAKLTTKPELLVEKCGAKSIQHFACETHHALLFAQNFRICDSKILKRVFTPEEQFFFYVYHTNKWLHFSGGWGHPLIECYTSYMTPLIDDIIGKAQEAVEGKNPHTADLRFTHDTYVVPLLSIFGFEGCSLQYTGNLVQDCCSSPLAKWMPMGANIQMVLYRNTEGKVLVRLLLNEQDMKLPIESATAPFYPWGEFRKMVDANMARLMKSREQVLPTLNAK